MRRATLHTTFALRRLKEAVQLDQQDDRWDPSTLEDMEQEFDKAAGLATARVVWEHIADATASGEEELASIEGSGDGAAAPSSVTDTLRRFHSRANLELGRLDNHADVQTVPSPTAAHAATATPSSPPGTSAPTAVQPGVRDSGGSEGDEDKVGVERAGAIADPAGSKSGPASLQDESQDRKDGVAPADRSAGEAEDREDSSLTGSQSDESDLRAADDGFQIKSAGDQHDSGGDRGDSHQSGGGGHESGKSEGGGDHHGSDEDG